MTARLVILNGIPLDQRDELLGALSSIHAASFTPAWRAEELAALLDHPGAVGIVAMDDEAPCAFGMARVAADEAEVLTVVTAAAARRQGHARALLAALEREAALLGACTMFLEVAADNAAARRLYDAGGYVEAGRRKGYYQRSGAGGVDALVLRKALPSA